MGGQDGATLEREDVAQLRAVLVVLREFQASLQAEGVLRGLTLPDLVRQIFTEAMGRAPEYPELTPAVCSFGPIEIDDGAHCVRVDGRRVEFTPLEYGILRELVMAGGNLVTKRNFSQRLWGRPLAVGTDPGSTSLALHVARIRTKLSAVGPYHNMLKNERGLGYRLVGG